MIKQMTVTVLALGWTMTAAVAAESRIEHLAPPNSIVVASIRNFDAAMDRLKSTQLWQLWRAEELADARAKMVKEYEEALKEALEEIGVEQDAVPMPHGSVGVAMFPALNDDLGINEPAFLLLADYGVEADKAAALAAAALKKGEESGELVVDEEQVLGRTLVTVTRKDQPRRPGQRGGPGRDEGGDEDDADMRFGGGDPLAILPQPEDFFKSLRKVHYVRDGSVLMLSSHRGSLEQALEGEQAPGAGQRLADNATFQQAGASLADADAWALIFVDNLTPLLGPAAMVSGMLKMYLGNLTALGLGARFDTPTAMVDLTWALHMPEGTAGLTSLMDTQTPRGAVPAFVPAEVLAYSTFNFEFSGLPGIIRQFITANAALMGGNPEEALTEIEPYMNLLATAIGSQVHSVTTLSQPIQFDSLKSVYAIRCEKPADVHAFMTQWGPDRGMQPRQFLGHSMWTMEAGGMFMMVPNPIMGGSEGMSVGLGGGQLFVGATSAVEQALRSVGTEGQSRLMDSAIYKRSTAALPSGPSVGWGFADLAQQIQAMRDIGVLAQRRMVEQARQFDPEYAKQLEQDLAQEKPTGLEKIDAAMFQRYFGPLVWRMTASDKGFLGKVYLLPPD